MSRDKRYQKLLNSREWGEVKRIVWQRVGGLCERCKREGIAERGVPYITPGVDCHHIRPVESARDEDEMKRLAYDPSNIELLCIPCHIKTHKEMGKFTPQHVADNNKRRAERTASWLDPHYKTNNDDRTNEG
jgi:5-methylcytosine-specific restriction endonuclease McrA